MNPDQPVPISGETRLAAVIGSPVGHSLSPALHNAAFLSAGLNWRFVAFEVAAGGASAAVAAMKNLGIAGYAVTMPHKADMAQAVDEVDDAAAVLRSVNTVVLRPDGSTLGVSTDGAGFVASLRSSLVEVSGLSIAVLGAGAAARSVVDALGRAGAGEIVIINRTRATADAVAELSDSAVVGSMTDIGRADLLVNTTSVGMGSQECPVDVSLLRPNLVVADIVYNPLETALLRAARARGAQTIDGLGMLVHQAVYQQELWTGVRPDVAALRAAAEAELSSR